MARFIELDRRKQAPARRALRQSVESLRGGACFLIFPEGTRSEAGTLGEFKKGGFQVALEAGSRIVPVAVRGTRELMTKGGFRIAPGIVRVAVLPPVDAREHRVESRQVLVAEVRGRIAGELS
jgi:1-acyl-sn-glycerol-3-phosphate acyltransferase